MSQESNDSFPSHEDTDEEEVMYKVEDMEHSDENDLPTDI